MWQHHKTIVQLISPNFTLTPTGCRSLSSSVKYCRRSYCNGFSEIFAEASLLLSNSWYIIGKTCCMVNNFLCLCRLWRNYVIQKNQHGFWEVATASQNSLLPPNHVVQVRESKYMLVAEILDNKLEESFAWGFPLLILVSFWVIQRLKYKVELLVGNVLHLQIY